MFAALFGQFRVLAAAALLMAGPGQADEMRLRLTGFDHLPGWQEDDLTDTLSAFRASCPKVVDPRLRGADWPKICAAAKSADDPREFFEAHFQPVRLVAEKPVLLTGYYEPELEGARERGGAYQFPIYRNPRKLYGKGKIPTREQIEAGALRGHGLELAWLSDPVEAYFLQVQGSGRIRLNDGGVLRAGFSGSNGHRYRSIGKELERRGSLGDRGITAQNIQSWVRENPTVGKALLNHNPRYVFFREVTDLPDEAGPIGSLGVPLTTLRSLAVDPDYIPLGSPVWVEKRGKDPLKRLMIAQDVGGAVKGPHRGDIFYGPGPDAGQRAGFIRDPGALYLLLPKAALDAFLSQG